MSFFLTPYRESGEIVLSKCKKCITGSCEAGIMLFLIIFFYWHAFHLFANLATILGDPCSDTVLVRGKIEAPLMFSALGHCSTHLKMKCYEIPGQSALSLPSLYARSALVCEQSVSLGEMGYECVCSSVVWPKINSVRKAPEHSPASECLKPRAISCLFNACVLKVLTGEPWITEQSRAAQQEGARV